MRYIPHTEDEVRDMLSVIGVPELDALVPSVEMGHELIPESIETIATRAERTLRWLRSE